MRRISRWAFVLVPVLVAGLADASEDKKEDGRLKPVEAVPRDELDTAVSATISSDGKFLYAASWRIATLNVYARDPKAGTLVNKQTLTNEDDLSGVTSLALSPDGRLACAVAFKLRTVLLYLRNPETGALTRSDVARDGEKDVRMQWPIKAAFSPDSQFVSIVDDIGNAEDQSGAVVTFRVKADKLEFVGTDAGNGGCYRGARGLAFHPSGKALFVASSRAGTVVVAERDPMTGKTSVRQVLRDDEGGVHGLTGAMSPVVSPDGRDVYVCSGRFGGANAVSAFRFGADDRLTLLQEFLDGGGELQGFLGGNSIALSPDGLNVYATATVSGSVASFRRDPATGKLNYLETIPDCGEGGSNGAAGLGISPDGRFVYVATEDRKTLSIFKGAIQAAD